MRRWLRFLPRGLRDRIILSRLRVDDDEVRGLTVKVATTVDEHEQACRLMHAAYTQHGYIQPHASGVWVTPHGLLPSTFVFVAKRGPEVVGTMSLIVDSELGLPMDKAYAAELAPLRAERRRIAEVGALCVAPGHRRRGIALLLNKIMARCAMERLDVQDLVISVLREAACLYETTLRFVQIGGVKTYPGLSKRARGVALRLDLETADAALARAFGTRPLDNGNPYYLYSVHRHPQIELPSATELGAQLQAVRRIAARRLGGMRPDCFASLDNPQRRAMRTMIPTLREHLHSTPILVAQ